MGLKQIRHMIERHRKVFTMGGIALLVGTVTAIAMHGYLQAQTQAIEARLNGKVATIVVAREDIPAGAPLTSENLAARRIPVEYVQSAAISADNYEALVGRVAAQSMKKGDAIVFAFLDGAKVPTFSARVAKGRRAITVPVDDINSISGLLEPDDKIDLIASNDRDGRRVTFPLVQQVRVLATGQRTVSDPTTGEKRQFSTVTLDTSPQEAQQIIAMREQGKLAALLRNPQDTQELGSNGMASVARQAGLRNNLAARKPVPILYGGGPAQRGQDVAIRQDGGAPKTNP